MKEVCYYNGKFLAYDEANTIAEDRGNTFGDGVYDAISAFNGIPFNLDRHVDRFFNSMAAIDIHSPYSKEQIKAVIIEALQKLNQKQSMVYFQMTRGADKRQHVYPEGMTGNFYLSVREKRSYAEERKNGACLISLPDDRWRRCDIKSINLLANVLAAKKAQENGCIEAILIRDGNAAECTASNVYIVKNGTIITEPLSPLILKGVSRSCLLEIIAPETGIPVEERHFSIEEVYDADEVFITSCTKLVLPITQVDGKKIGDGTHSVSDKLFSAYAAYAEAQCGPIEHKNI